MRRGRRRRRFPRWMTRQDGLRMDLRVLGEYYSGSSSESLLLLNQAWVEAPKCGHSKDAGASTGITGMLEVIESDFGRSLVEAQTGEDTKADDYKKLTDQNKVTKINKEADMKYEASTSAAITKALQEVISDKEASQAELDAELQYKESLDKHCTQTA
ncbi:unnamed protein product [Polarella glacialis]|uniref:Uncharacterized protein n=1 Tax=Polarella glacialis TaxID=89957 RepID=A0A813EV58_POLGL|nr:unnamed protein product [Polarella glacialis]CAE8688733.1 unnamed protein product [Polarella glacialis]